MRLIVASVTALLVVSVASGRDHAHDAAGWKRIEPGGETTCARGGPYAFWARLADRKRLVVFFQGGGGCFDETTCAVGSSWFDDSVGAEDDPAYAGGVLDLHDRRNPFRMWSWLFVPSCTGDVHMGDKRARYGSVSVEQRGWRNARAALRWAFRRFGDLEAVFVTGCSAGSVGSAFHVPAVLDRWPRARVTQLGDSLAFVFHRPLNLTDWGAHRHFPSFFRIGQRRFTMAEYLRALARRYPRRMFARFNHASDDVQERFYRAVGGDPEGFQPRLRAAEAQLKKLPNYRSFLACGNEHCSLPMPAFYGTRVGRVALRDWVADLASGLNVSCPICRRSR